MYESTQDFFQETGLDKQDFAQVEKSANAFGAKFKETFSEEFNKHLQESTDRAKRLDAKEPLVFGLPNSFLYLVMYGAAIYLMGKLIFKK